MTRKEQIRAALLGHVLGDALGVPFEHVPREEMQAAPCTGMTGHGTYDQPIGTWSDDTSMTLATVEAIKRTWHHYAVCWRSDLAVVEEIMLNFRKWFEYGMFTPHGEVFDCGCTCEEAIRNFSRKEMDIEECGLSDEWSNGNGALMRILPMALLGKWGQRNLRAVAALTHNHECSHACCEVYVQMVQSILNGTDDWKTAYQVLAPYSGLFKQLGFVEREDAYQKLRSTGFVVDTLSCAVYCLTHTESYRECVLMAVNMGGDADTLAAVAGGLAGMLYGIGGEKGIPEEWLNVLVRREYIEQLISGFADTAEEVVAEPMDLNSIVDMWSKSEPEEPLDVTEMPLFPVECTPDRLENECYRKGLEKSGSFTPEENEEMLTPENL